MHALPSSRQIEFVCSRFRKGIAGKPVLRLLGAAPPSAAGDERGVVGEARGVNVHASASVHGRDKAQVERLCRYLMRPALSQRAS